MKHCSSCRIGSRVVWILFAALLVLHQDFWNWDNRTLLGFLPIGLAYHMGFSIAAALLWLLAVRCAWPQQLEQWATGDAAKPADDLREEHP